MFGKSEKIFNVYEKPEAAEPTERMVLVREGFCFWAFLFNFFYLIFRRLWWVLGGYVLALVALGVVVEALHFTEPMTLLVQTFINLALGVFAYDLEGWSLRRGGYRMAGVLVAETELHAERRYHEFAG